MLFFILALTGSMHRFATAPDPPRIDQTLEGLVRCVESDSEASASAKDRFWGGININTNSKREKKGFND